MSNPINFLARFSNFSLTEVCRSGSLTYVMIASRKVKVVTAKLPGTHAKLFKLLNSDVCRLYFITQKKEKNFVIYIRNY